MESLSVPFAAGTMHLLRFGPSHHPARRYERVKLGVLLGNTTARHWSAKYGAWQRVPAQTVNLCTSGEAGEVQLAGDGQFLALEIEAEFIDKRLAGMPFAERRRFDVLGARDPFLLQLAKEAAGLLRGAGALPASYVEAMARLASVHLGHRYLVARARDERQKTVTLNPHVVQRVTRHIEAHLDGPLPLAELAACAGLSPFHFARAFRATVGETPHRYIVQRRVITARKLLLAGEGADLAEAAFRTGFSSQSHLTRCFREVCGMTPGEFLRKERPRGARK